MTLATLGAAERAWCTLTEALSLPAPEGDGGQPWTVYLVDGVEGAGTALVTDRDPIATVDRGSSFGLVDRHADVGCALDLALARAVARGSLWRASPSTDEGSARAECESVARLAVHCAHEDNDLRVFQSQPERTIVDPTGPAFDRGAAFFFDWVDANYGTQPGSLIAGVWALSATRTPLGASRWSARPTGFDVLRVSLSGVLWQGSTLADLFGRAATARALVSPHVRLAWSIPWPDRPRRLASPRAPSPTGSSYIVVEHAGAPAGAKLRIEADWEDYGRMRWTVAKLGPSGQAIAVLPITSPDRATHAAMTVEPLDGIDRVLIVGTNVGSTEHRFDPDQGVWEPHGWLLTLLPE